MKKGKKVRVSNLFHGKGKIKLLIVDDSSFIRSFVITALANDKELSVVGAVADGDEVLSFVRRNAVDIILMDIGMKRMNGDIATVEVLKEYPQIKVVGFSSYKDQEVRNRMIECGASGYVFKSTPIRHVALVIKSVFDPSFFLNLNDLRNNFLIETNSF